jgi:hypothetical protein
MSFFNECHVAIIFIFKSNNYFNLSILIDKFVIIVIEFINLFFDIFSQKSYKPGCNVGSPPKIYKLILLFILK